MKLLAFGNIPAFPVELQNRRQPYWGAEYHRFVIISIPFFFLRYHINTGEEDIYKLHAHEKYQLMSISIQSLSTKHKSSENLHVLVYTSSMICIFNTHTFFSDIYSCLRTLLGTRSQTQNWPANKASTDGCTTHIPFLLPMVPVCTDKTR